MKEDVSNGIDEVKILWEYKQKKTPDGRRDCIKRMAAERGVPASVIAEFLLEKGCQVDGRLVRGKNTRKVSQIDEIPGWDGPQEVTKEEPEEPEDPPQLPPTEPTVDPAPEPDAPEEKPEAPAKAMTVGVLRELLQDVSADVELYFGTGGPVLGIHVTGFFDADGRFLFGDIFLLGEDDDALALSMEKYSERKRKT